MSNFNIHSEVAKAKNHINIINTLFTFLDKEKIKNANIIMDNASFHKCTEIKEFVEERENIKLYIFLHTALFSVLLKIYFLSGNNILDHVLLKMKRSCSIILIISNIFYRMSNAKIIPNMLQIR
jgi:hypothetical protein